MHRMGRDAPLLRRGPGTLAPRLEGDEELPLRDGERQTTHVLAHDPAQVVPFGETHSSRHTSASSFGKSAFV